MEHVGANPRLLRGECVWLYWVTPGMKVRVHGVYETIMGSANARRDWLVSQTDRSGGYTTIKCGTNRAIKFKNHPPAQFPERVQDYRATNEFRRDEEATNCDYMPCTVAYCQPFLGKDHYKRVQQEVEWIRAMQALLADQKRQDEANTSNQLFRNEL
jgi:hypothetical protein